MCSFRVFVALVACLGPTYFFHGGCQNDSFLPVLILPVKAWKYAFTGVGLSVCLYVCLSVTTITKKIVDGFVPNLWEGSKGERENQVRVSLRSVAGRGSNGQKLRKM